MSPLLKQKKNKKKKKHVRTSIGILLNYISPGLLTKLKLKVKESPPPLFFNTRTHGKQHDGCKGMRINPLTAKRNA